MWIERPLLRKVGKKPSSSRLDRPRGKKREGSHDRIVSLRKTKQEGQWGREGRGREGGGTYSNQRSRKIKRKGERGSQGSSRKKAFKWEGKGGPFERTLLGCGESE